MNARWIAALLVEVFVLAALLVALPLFVFVMATAQGLVP